MAFNIREFQSNISSLGYLQTNAYEVYFPLPSILAGKTYTVSTGTEASFDSATRILTTRADRVSLPGVNLLTSEVFRDGIGTSEKKPFNAQFTDLTVQFIGDKEGVIWSMFDNWINSIYSFSGSETEGSKYTFNYKNEYSTYMLLKVFNKYGNSVIDIRFERLFPVSIVEIPLSWQDRSNMMRIQVVFNYKTWFTVNSRSAF